MSDLIARRYAKALYTTLADQAQLNQALETIPVYEDLFTHQQVKQIFLNPVMSSALKKDLLSYAQEKTINPSKNVLYCFYTLIDAGRAHLSQKVIDLFKEMADEAKGVVRVHVDTATALSETQKQKLENYIKEITNKKTVIFNEKITTHLLSGFNVRFGYYSINLRVRDRLTKLLSEIGG